MATFTVQNRYLGNNRIGGATIEIDPPMAGIGNPAASGVTHQQWGTCTINLRPPVITPGTHRVRVTAPHTHTQAVGPGLVNTVGRSRIYRLFEFNIVVNAAGGITAVTVPGTQGDNGAVTRQNNGIQVAVQPVWMASPNRSGRGGTAIDTVVIHHTGSPSTQSTLNTFLGQGNSAHYVIDPQGRVIKMVLDADRANHAGAARWRGNRNLNSRSIGIEIQHRAQDGNYPQAQYTALIALLQRLTAAHGGIQIRNIIGHSDIAIQGGRLGRKQGDPGVNFHWEQIENANFGMIPGPLPAAANPPYGQFFSQHAGDSLQLTDNDATRRCGGAIRTAITDAPVRQVQQDLTDIGYHLGTPDGDFGRGTAAAVLMFQEHFFTGGRNGPTDGRVNLATAEMIKRVLNGV